MVMPVFSGIAILYRSAIRCKQRSTTKNGSPMMDFPFRKTAWCCVRRSWLCGVDPYNGKDYSHLKQWVRERLGNLSWVMRSLNEPLARRANKEDGCKGQVQGTVLEWCQENILAIYSPVRRLAG